jgi:aminoglycoside phosphotransferase family enzyme/predicted kinase
LELRRRACLREVELNRRTAPELYIDAVAITRAADGALALGGPGEAVEWAVVMRRFPQEALGDRLAQAGRFTLDLARALADEVTAFHDHAAPMRAAAGGGAAGLRAVIDENFAELRQRPDLFPTADVAALEAAAGVALAQVAALLDRRLAEGLVRHCHGDLHLRNICVIDGRPRIFDCIEFNDTIACIDVLYDLAFLLMDLEHRGLRPHANRLLNRYLQGRDDVAGLAALPLFLSTRASVRAKVSVSVADSQADPATARRLCDEAAGYFRAARAYLQPVPPGLVAVGGLSGTGKTCLARELAPGLGAPPGALHLRSDVLRKSYHGVDELRRLPSAAYGAAASAEVYARLAAAAKAGLAAGRAVIADAVYADPAERGAIEAVARDLGVPFVGLWLEAPATQIVGRVAGRRGDASDATPAVVRRQLTYDIGPMTWHRLDASGARATVAAEARARFKSPD